MIGFRIHHGLRGSLLPAPQVRSVAIPSTVSPRDAWHWWRVRSDLLA